MNNITSWFSDLLTLAKAIVKKLLSYSYIASALFIGAIVIYITYRNMKRERESESILNAANSTTEAEKPKPRVETPEQKKERMEKLEEYAARVRESRLQKNRNEERENKKGKYDT